MRKAAALEKTLLPDQWSGACDWQCEPHFCPGASGTCASSALLSADTAMLPNKLLVAHSAALWQPRADEEQGKMGIM